MKRCTTATNASQKGAVIAFFFFFFLRNCTPQTKEEALEVRNLIYEPNFHLFTSLSPHFYLQVAVILVQENKTSQNEE